MAKRSNIKMNAFAGMNNIKASEGLFVKRGIVEPRIILNADVTEEGRILKRDGQTKIISLTDGHSEWAGATCHLVMDGTTLKRITGTTATSIEDLGGVKIRTDYAEVGDLVYISNESVNAIYDPIANSVSDWGLSVPVQPVLSSGSGNLPAGKYYVCLTRKSGDEISGNGPISEITLTADKGIVIGNRPADCIAWCTDVNGDIFYLIGEQDTIVTIPTVEPLPSLFCSPPPYMENICHAFGRMWGSVDNLMYYSESFHPEWWKLAGNRFEYATDITMIAKSPTGIFVGCEDRTKFMEGTNPTEMREKDVGAGSIPGTMTYCNDIVELGDTISPPEKKHHSVPVWVSEEGIVAGNPAGRLFSLSQQKIRFSPGNEGASLYRKKNGHFQFLTAMIKGAEDSGIGFSDDATVEVIRNGTVL